MSRHFLGIDSGSSATKWALVDESGKEIKRGKSISVDGHLYREESRINWAKLLDELLHELPDPIVAIYAGVTGASDYPEENQQITDLIMSRFPQSKVHVVMDVALGYRANVSDPHGVYLYAGTGSIAVYKDINGKHRTVGGWGYLLGDEGAGYWMGISALQEILSELERNTFDSRLGSIIASDGKTPTFNQVKELVYGSPRSKVAALAKEIIGLAKAGDEKANRIIKSAAKELASLVQRTRLVLGVKSGSVVFGGGIARASDEIVQEISAILGTTIEVSSDDLSLEAARFAVEDFSATS